MMLELINMKILSLIFIYGKKVKRAAESGEKKKMLIISFHFTVIHSSSGCRRDGRVAIIQQA